MKRILFVAPSSIPVDGPEAIVNLKLLEVLARNYEIDLISKRSHWRFYPEENGEEIRKKLSSVNIVCVDNSFSLSSVFYHLMCFIKFGFVYKGSHWAYKALCVLKSLCKTYRYDAIITKSYPAEILGYYAAKKYGIKWVATWNDPFPLVMMPYPYGKGAEYQLPFYSRKVIKVIEKYADYNVFPSARLYHYMRTYIKLNEKGVFIVPHVAIKQNRCHSRKKDLCMVALGNSCFPRDPSFLVKAVGVMVNEGKNVYLDFIGVVDSHIRDLIINLQIADHVKVHSPLSYSESLKVLDDYDMAIVVEAPCIEGIFLPTKLGDFVQSSIPVWAISPRNGVLNDLYGEGTIGYFSDCTSIESIENELHQIYNDFIDDALKNSNIHETFYEDAVEKQYKDMI